MQIMVLLTSALRAEHPLELRLQALEGWMAIMRALTRITSLHSHFISIMDQASGALAIPRAWGLSIAFCSYLVQPENCIGDLSQLSAGQTILTY